MSPFANVEVHTFVSPVRQEPDSMYGNFSGNKTYETSGVETLALEMFIQWYQALNAYVECQGIVDEETKISIAESLLDSRSFTKIKPYTYNTLKQLQTIVFNQTFILGPELGDYINSKIDTLEEMIGAQDKEVLEFMISFSGQMDDVLKFYFEFQPTKVKRYNQLLNFKSRFLKLVQRVLQSKLDTYYDERQRDCPGTTITDLADEMSFLIEGYVNCLLRIVQSDRKLKEFPLDRSVMTGLLYELF
ncbi:uncharacterized protein RJT21DRAFT_17375 [Scheffersomyces amazonensis]|uniref:uncharacterized protein n=1 Tax=Scheffersomyces amazonensis TaxID=1078765 RepID=UPI00315D2F4E